VTPSFCNTTAPVTVESELCGVQAKLFPETQYEYFRSRELVVPASVATLAEVLYVPLADRSVDTKPIPPICWTIPEHEHPPSATVLQLTLSKPRFCITLAA
jgi:hypothetical protein